MERSSYGNRPISETPPSADQAAAVERLKEIAGKSHHKLKLAICWALLGITGYGIYDHDNVQGIIQEMHEDMTMSKTDAEIASRVRSEVGSSMVGDIEGLDSIKDASERAHYLEERKDKSITVSGFEQCPGCPSNEQIKKVLNNLPKAYRYNVGVVDYKDVEKLAPPEYNFQAYPNGTPVKTAAFTLQGTNQITYLKGIAQSQGEALSPQETSAFLLSSLSHEAAHKSDWVENKALTVSERMVLAIEIINRVNSSDRFKSDEVEIANNSNKQLELQLKAREYYAEITRAYFEGDSKLSEQDKQIVEQVIHKTDPSFKRSDANKYRLAVNKVLADREGHGHRNFAVQR